MSCIPLIFYIMINRNGKIGGGPYYNGMISGESYNNGMIDDGPYKK